MRGSPGGTARLPLPEPRTEVARAVAHGLLAGPECQRTVTEWAATYYVSATSLSRAFRSETGLTFSEWCTRARLNASLGLLASRRAADLTRPPAPKCDLPEI